MNNNGKMGQLVVVSGPSGSGKDTILNEIFKMDPDIIPSVSATTRPPRRGEINGVNYYFMSVEEFEERIKRDEFLEYVQYGDNYYGTLKPQLEEKLKTGKTVVLIIDVRGAVNVRKVYPTAKTIFILPPTESELEKRLRCRESETETSLLKRLEVAKDEIKRVNEYDYAVVNDELEKAVEKVYNIIKRTISIYI